MSRINSAFLQRVINILGSRLIVDGIVGNKTNAARNKHGSSRVDSLIYMFNNHGPTGEFSALTLDLMGYLAIWEGKELHWNKTEGGFTTPYGVYSVAHSNASPVIYINRLFTQQLGLSISRPNYPYVKSHIAGSYTISNQVIISVAKFYHQEYILRDEKILSAVGKLRKTRLSFLSISINGGRGRAHRAIQSALGVRVDGVIGPITMGKLVDSDMDDSEFNKKLLSYMRGFYVRIIARRPKKYARYKNGWNNRLDGLA